jgi:hypothetical protein
LRLLETMMIRDRGVERAVKVILDAPSLEALDIEALAQRAWNSIGKKVTMGEVNVSEKAFGR